MDVYSKYFWYILKMLRNIMTSEKNNYLVCFQNFLRLTELTGKSFCSIQENAG